jgi:hypothetical protein
LTLAATAAALVVLLLATAALRTLAKWPSEKSETVVLIGVLLLSLLPIALALLDVIVDRGGSIKYGSVEIDFSRSKEKGIAGITVLSNIGVPGLPVSDSATTQILDTLRQATASEIVVVDLPEQRGRVHRHNAAGELLGPCLASRADERNLAILCVSRKRV